MPRPIPYSDSLYDERAICPQCGAVVSACDERCSECYARFRDEESCELCGGELAILGTLGNREHYRCVCCGSDQSVER